MNTEISSLIYVPILHTQKEAEEILTALQGDKIAGPAADTFAQEKSVREMWDGIYEKIQQTNIPCFLVRIYQDALPVGGREREIITRLAERGSCNHQIILELVRKGAKLEGTEDADLLLKEYDNLLSLAEKTSASIQSYRDALEEYKGKSTKLMRERDAFIAERIKHTLESGEIPLVFMGVRHELEKQLQQHFVMHYIIYRLPFKQVQGGK